MGYSIFLLLVTGGLLCRSTPGANADKIEELSATISHLQGTAYFNIEMSQAPLDDVFAPAITMQIY